MLDLSATRMTDQCQTDHKLESQNCYESEKNKGKYGVGLGGGGFRGFRGPRCGLACGTTQL